MTVYNDRTSQYIQDLFVPQDAALRHVLEDTPRKGLPTINVKPEEGRFLQFLARAIGAKKALEVGTLGGYSGIWIARGLAPGGKLITIEKEPHHAEVARQHFNQANLDGRVEIRLGNAHQILQSLTGEGPYDFIFIDAEKDGYPAYLDWALKNTRLGGVIAAHNAFRHGSVVNQGDDDLFTALMREFNRRFANEPRLISTIFPAGDGMLIGVKIA